MVQFGHLKELGCFDISRSLIFLTSLESCVCKFSGQDYGVLNVSWGPLLFIKYDVGNLLVDHWLMAYNVLQADDNT